MRFTAYRNARGQGLAASRDGTAWHGLSQSDPTYPGSLDDLVRTGDFERAARVLLDGPAIDLSKVTILPPFTRSSKILCIGLNYVDHAAESGIQLPDYPTVFVRFATSLVGHGQPLVCPSVSDQFDYEAELVVVIGKGGRRIREEDALAHVAGYSIFNDGSVRDYQKRTPQWTIGKNFDATGGFGPVFITAAALPPGAAGLRVRSRLNGDVMQDGRTDDMVFGVARLVSLLSATMTLKAGDLIVTGTPAGVGMGRNPPVYMKDGDICEVEIEGIGVLRNPVIKERTPAA